MRPWVMVSIGALLAASCESVVPLERPPNAGARAVLLVLGEGERALAVRVIDRASPDWSPFGARDGQALYAVSFSCDAARLGLSPGAQALTEARADAALTPPPAAVHRLALTGEAGAWAREAAPPPAVEDALERLPLPPEALCHAVGARFEPTEVIMPRDQTRGPPAFVVPVDADHVLAGSRSDQLFLVGRDGVAVRVPEHEGKKLRAGARTADGTLYLIGDRGALWRGTLSGGLTLITSSTTALDRGYRRAAVAAAPPSAPFELFLTGQTYDGDMRAFYRWDGARWISLATTRLERETLFYPAAAWVAPGEAVAIGLHPTQVNGLARAQGDAVSTELLPGPAGPSSVMQHPTLGTLIGRDDGEIDRVSGTRWDALVRGLPVTFVRTLVAQGEGFVYTAARESNFTASAVGQYQPSVGFCRTTDTFTEFAINHLVRLDDDTLVALTLGGFDAPMGVTILRRTQAPASCSADE